MDTAHAPRSGAHRKVPVRPAILVVEDEGIFARELQQTLASFGYDAFAIAASAEEAIAEAEKRRPDLVLMDIRIPGVEDGIDTAERMRRCFRVPVIYLTAHADDATVERAKLTEPYGCLLKPVDPSELKWAIELSLHKHARESEVHERERWFSTTLGSIADAVLCVDLSSRVTFMNAVAAQLLGVSADNSLGRPVEEVLVLVDRPEGMGPTIRRVLSEKKAQTVFECQVRDARTGEVRLLADSVAPVLDGGEPVGAVMVFRDAGAEKALQRRLELTDRLSALGTLAAGVAHEINNPLTAVTANGSFLEKLFARELAELEGDASPESEIRRQRLGPAHQMIQDVRSAAARIARIVSDLRSFSRPTPSSESSSDVRRAFEWALRTTAHEVRLRARLERDLGDVPPVAGDDTRLGQVLVNLLINAAHSIAPGRPEENRITVRTSTDARGWISIEVSDTGSGIPPELQHRIFDPFYTTKPVGIGTGLGLAVTRGIVHSMGGELTVESQPDLGSTFRVVLPPAASTPKRSSRSAPREASSLRGRVLVIDDEPLVLNAVRRILSAHETVCVGEPREALARLLAGDTFDVILCDLLMPSLSGREIFEELTRFRPELAARMVFLTGQRADDVTESFLGSFSNPVLEKPFEPELLRSTVASVLED